MTANVQHLFMYLLVIYVSLGEMSVQLLCPLFNYIAWFFATELNFLKVIILLVLLAKIFNLLNLGFSFAEW